MAGSMSAFGVPLQADDPWTGRGNEYYLDAVNGRDSWDGSKGRPWKTLARAYGTLLDRTGEGDTLYVISHGNASDGFTRIVNEVDDYGLVPVANGGAVWDVDMVRVIGVNAGGINPRSSFRVETDDILSTKIMTISGDANRFENMNWYQGSTLDAAQIALTISGQRNKFIDCEAQGAASAHPAGQAGSRSLKLSGGSENQWIGGRIGLTTIARTAAMAELELASASTRNIFDGVLFESYHAAAGGDGCLFITVPSGGIDRYAIFRNCLFVNCKDSAGRAMTAAMTVNASAGGTVILAGCLNYGATDWCSADGQPVAVNPSYDGTDQTTVGGLMVAPTQS